MLFIFINQNSICNPSLNYLYAFNVRLIFIFVLLSAYLNTQLMLTIYVNNLLAID